MNFLRRSFAVFILKVDMSKTRAQKEEITERLADRFGRMKSAAFVSIHGYTMKDADALRAKGRKTGVEVSVAKKTLLRIAAQKAGVSSFSLEGMDGSVLSAFSFQDEVSAAYLAAELVKDKPDMKVMGGMLEGAMVDASKMRFLATLPGKQELYAKMVGSLQAPVSGFVNVLAGNLRGLVRVLDAIKTAKS